MGTVLRAPRLLASRVDSVTDYGSKLEMFVAFIQAGFRMYRLWLVT